MIRLAAILFCFVFALSAQETPREIFSAPGTLNPPPAETAPRPQYNFLFLLDTSMSMAARKPAAIKMIHDVITSGFNGQIEPGDSIDIWTFDRDNHIARFPPQIWEHEDANRIATIAARFVEYQKFKGRSRFIPVAADLESLLPHTSGLIAVIITDAEPPIAGIRLDLEINEHVTKEKLLRPGSRQPLLISIAAVHGEYSGWTAYQGEGTINLGILPKRPKPLPVIAEAPPQKLPEPEKDPEPEPPVVIDYPPGTTVTAIIPVTPTPEPIQDPSPSSPVASTETTPADAVQAASTLPVKPAVSAEPPPQAKAAPAPATSPLAQAAKTSLKKPVATSKTSIKPPSAIEPNQPASALTTPAIPTSAIYIAIATGLGFVAMGAFLFLRRTRSRYGSSIISKSLQQ